jgi:hypothetical protein
MTDDRCAATRTALDEAFLERTAPGADVRAHVDGCAECRAVEGELRAVADAFAALPEPTVSDRVVARTLLRGRAEVVAGAIAERSAVVSRRTLPPGFGRELARLLAVALAALPAVLVWNVVVIRFGGRLLEGLLPEPVLGVLAGAYVASVAGWLAFLYGSIPFVAHRRVQRTSSEVMG